MTAKQRWHRRQEEPSKSARVEILLSPEATVGLGHCHRMAEGKRKRHWMQGEGRGGEKSWGLARKTAVSDSEVTAPWPASHHPGQREQT